ncbi:hypothetical protein [Candidatus Lokiarchaeum ossiferum]|uniref:hypothetical protein n=1 Tax=Candidatus Lokiarchaeum ossiferum TaxID=2951803 RepID=UPI00352E7DE6
MRITIPKSIIDEFGITPEFQPKLIKVYGPEPYLKIQLPTSVSFETQYYEITNLVRQEGFLSKRDFWNQIPNKKSAQEIWNKLIDHNGFKIMEDGIYSV